MSTNSFLEKWNAMWKDIQNNHTEYFSNANNYHKDPSVIFNDLLLRNGSNNEEAGTMIGLVSALCICIGCDIRKHTDFRAEDTFDMCVGFQVVIKTVMSEYDTDINCIMGIIQDPLFDKCVAAIKEIYAAGQVTDRIDIVNKHRNVRWEFPVEIMDKNADILIKLFKPFAVFRQWCLAAAVTDGVLLVGPDEIEMFVNNSRAQCKKLGLVSL